MIRRPRFRAVNQAKIRRSVQCAPVFGKPGIDCSAQAMCIMWHRFTHTTGIMRTNIDIDDDLLEAAMRATGQTTKRGTVEEALRRVVTRQRRLQAIENVVGIDWIDPEETARALSKS
jgi:Arc/MetJ family transcription regulator